MSSVPMQDREYGAACLSTAIEASLKRFIGKEKEVRSALNHAKRTLHWPGHVAAFCRSLFEYSLTFEDYEDLLPFLDACERALPMTLAVPAGASCTRTDIAELDGFADIAMRSGDLQSTFDSHPKVEGWVRKTAEHIVRLFTQSEGFRWDDTDRITRQQLAVFIAVHDLVGGAHECIVAQPLEKQYVSHLGFCIGSIRRALECTVDWILANEPGATGEAVDGEKTALTENKLRALAEHRFDPRRLSAREHFGGVRFYLDRFNAQKHSPPEGGVSELSDYIAFLQRRGRIPSLAALLQSDPLFGDFGEDAEGEALCPLPVGSLTIARALSGGPDGERWVLYSVNGFVGMSEFTIADGAAGEARHTSVLHFPDRTFVCDTTRTCSFDPSGKPFLSLNRDRLAPLLSGGSFRTAFETLRKANARCRRWVYDMWMTDPDLVNRAATDGPLIVVSGDGWKTIVCRQKVQQSLGSLRNWQPDDPVSTGEILARLGIRAAEPCSSFTVRTGSLPSVSDDARERDAFRRLIREKVGKGKIPDFKWISARLKPFGVRETTMGKGSHGSLLLTREGGTKRQSTWHTLRSTESLEWFLLWEMLHKLGISEEEFYESL